MKFKSPAFSPFIILVPLLWICGCGHSPFRTHIRGAARPPARLITAGVTYREIPFGDAVSPNSEAHLLEVDLRTPGVKVRVASDRTGLSGGRLYGDCYTVRDWCRRQGAVGGINGGFFGATENERKEVIGLLASGGEVLASGRLNRSPEHPDRKIVRCVFGITAEGMPHIGWSVGLRGRGALLTDYGTPLNPTTQSFWTASSAVACGPRLIKKGIAGVTDREERLVSPPALRRTFVAYDMENGKPRHLIMGIGLSMTFKDVAVFLQQHFKTTYGSACAEAMCLDGGSSTQLAYRVPIGYTDALPTSVTVPTAILIEDKPH